jgi:hypothetical protein
MDKKLKAKWVKALRSGKYAQGQTVMFNDNTGAYCCLGVLCEVSGIEMGNYSDVRDLIGADAVHALYGLNDDCFQPPFELIAGLIHEAL